MALGVRGEEGADARERRWDGDRVRWERPVGGGGEVAGRWAGGVFLLTMLSVEDVAVYGLWSCGEVGMEARRGEVRRS